MVFNTAMPQTLRPFFKSELRDAKAALKKGQLSQSWAHLERAHILGQPYPIEHTYTHWKMLKFGIQIKNTKEIFGQIPRLLVGGIKSFVGKVPIGNTGGADVPPLKSMIIPADLQEILKDHGK